MGEAKRTFLFRWEVGFRISEVRWKWTNRGMGQWEEALALKAETHGRLTDRGRC
jgi:hypothetical protein